MRAVGSADLRKFVSALKGCAGFLSSVSSRRMFSCSRRKSSETAVCRRRFQGLSNGLKARMSASATIRENGAIPVARHPCQSCGQFCSARRKMFEVRSHLRKCDAAFRSRHFDEFQMTALWCHSVRLLAIARGLHLKHLGVTSAQACQLVVSPFLRDPAVFQNYDAVGRTHG